MNYYHLSDICNLRAGESEIRRVEENLSETVRRHEEEMNEIRKSHQMEIETLRKQHEAKVSIYF